jgi:hypothetical protein
MKRQAGRDYARLLQLEFYAYLRWRKSGSVWAYRLAVACTRAVKAHPEYRGVL